MEYVNIKHRLSNEYLLNENNKSNIQVEIDLDANNPDILSKGLHYCVLLDASGSMYYAITDTRLEKAEHTKTINIENGYGSAVIADTTIHIAIRSLNTIINMLDANDRLTVITYNEEARVLFEGYTIEQKNEMIEKIKEIPNIYRNEVNKYTNMSKALKLGRETLNKYSNDNKKMIFITDGRPSFNIIKNGMPIDTREATLREIINLVTEKIAIDFIGLACIKYTNPKNIESLNKSEQLDFAFLELLSSKANGNISLVKNEGEFNYELRQIIQKSKSSYISNIELLIKFNELVSVREYYMSEPQMKYYGNLNFNINRIACINLNEIDLEKSYKFILDLDVFKDSINGEHDLNMMAIKARYKLNNKLMETKVSHVGIKIGDDIQQSRRINGAVESNYKLATIKKYESRYLEAYKREDTQEVISNISAIIDIYNSQGYYEEEEKQKVLLHSFIKSNNISQSDINKSRHTSTTIKSGNRPIRINEYIPIRRGIRAIKNR